MDGVFTGRLDGGSWSAYLEAYQGDNFGEDMGKPGRCWRGAAILVDRVDGNGAHWNDLLSIHIGHTYYRITTS